MKIKVQSAFVMLSVLLAACGKDDDSNPTFDYPIVANFTGVSGQTAMKIYVKSGGVVSEITAAETTVDEDEVFTDYLTDPSYTRITFQDETNAELYDNDPFFGLDSVDVTYVFDKDAITFTQSFGGLSITNKAVGDPTDFGVESSVYVLYDDTGFNYSAQGYVLESEETLMASMNDGDTLAYVFYYTDYKQ